MVVVEHNRGVQKIDFQCHQRHFSQKVPITFKPRTDEHVFLDKFLGECTYDKYADRLYLFVCTRNLTIFFLDNFYEPAGIKYVNKQFPVKCSLLHVHTSMFPG